MIECPRCFSKNIYTDKFCVECGHEIPTGKHHEVDSSGSVPGYIASSEEAFEKHWAKIARCYPRNGGGIDLKSLAHGIWQAAIKFKTAT